MINSDGREIKVVLVGEDSLPSKLSFSFLNPPYCLDVSAARPTVLEANQQPPNARDTSPPQKKKKPARKRSNKKNKPRHR